ncbi:2-keto-4-pentenoate hydratase [Variovorax sp. J22G73]|uniref:2-keto-4-pentenoate hydratase n=1 Tax=unclassified Variovorax TaxID=663243 RepID=UPI002574A853|nr:MULTISPECIES: 2-keto-4-pentenoate hydratase [unclassified Variovorax]MDM0009425.1 2-keto-4-pentenoate hydratase [Variovorax sp. J22R203]MDM0101932.1 2-keto-4-pentenoate hydratase [Variovorax sp. J22G73]
MDALQNDLAQRLRAARDTGVPIAPIRDLVGVADVDAAYAIQDINTRDAIASGRRLTGRKIGLTSLAVQKQLGVSQPDFGMLFADMQVGEGEPIAMQRLQQPKIEAEIALILGQDLTGDELTMADVLRATAYVLPALEIVGSRIANWNIGIVDTIADNASAGLFVLGGPAHGVAGLDMKDAAMVMTRNGETVSTGSGAACLGHPLNAATWLAREMVRRRRPLRAGDIVLTGALGPMVPVQPGDRFVATVEGLGTVEALFSGASA